MSTSFKFWNTEFSNSQEDSSTEKYCLFALVKKLLVAFKDIELSTMMSESAVVLMSSTKVPLNSSTLSVLSIMGSVMFEFVKEMSFKYPELYCKKAN